MYSKKPNKIWNTFRLIINAFNFLQKKGGAMKGVTFGNLHSYRDLNLILAEKIISPPSPKTELIEIPGSDGVLDFTEFFDGIKYNNRKLSFVFSTIVPQSEFMTLFSTVQNALHGQKMMIYLDDDPGWYYIGRVTVSEWKSDRLIGKLTVDCDCEPYKYRMRSQAVYMYGKNILDLTNLEQGVLGSVLGKTWAELTANASTLRLRSKIAFPIKANTQYTFSVPDSTFKAAIRQFDKNNVLIATTDWNTGTLTFKTLAATVTFAVFMGFSDDTTIVPSDVAGLKFQIEEGSVATAFEAYDTTAKELAASFSNIRKPAIPTIYVSTAMTVENGHNLATLNPGANVLPEFAFVKGENTLIFKGNGSAVVEWKEGGL